MEYRLPKKRLKKCDNGEFEDIPFIVSLNYGCSVQEFLYSQV